MPETCAIRIKGWIKLIELCTPTPSNLNILFRFLLINKESEQYNNAKLRHWNLHNSELARLVFAYGYHSNSPKCTRVNYLNPFTGNFQKALFNLGILFIALNKRQILSPTMVSNWMDRTFLLNWADTIRWMICRHLAWLCLRMHCRYRWWNLRSPA